MPRVRPALTTDPSVPLKLCSAVTTPAGVILNTSPKFPLQVWGLVVYKLPSRPWAMTERLGSFGSSGSSLPKSYRSVKVWAGAAIAAARQNRKVMQAIFASAGSFVIGILRCAELASQVEARSMAWPSGLRNHVEDLVALQRAPARGH